MVSNREPFTDLKQKAKELTGATRTFPKPSQKEIYNIGTAIYAEFNNVGKEKLGKSFGEILSVVPEAGIQKSHHLQKQT